MVGCFIPLYKIGIKQIKNKPMETTEFQPDFFSWKLYKKIVFNELDNYLPKKLLKVSRKVFLLIMHMTFNI